MRTRLMLVSAMALSMAGCLTANAQGLNPAAPLPFAEIPPLQTPGDPSRTGSEDMGIDPLRLSAVLQHFAQDAFDMLQNPISADVDMSLSYKMMSFYHIQIDMAQALLRYSTDPELRRNAARDLEIAAERIATLRTWQVSRQILQQQITGQLPFTPSSLSGGKGVPPTSAVPSLRAPATR